jgi:hypothetical protein
MVVEEERITWNRLLSVVDGSAASAAALRFALQLAAGGGTGPGLLHLVLVPPEAAR